ncbi:hypothetical protein Acr_00g0052120 [Actinidia rufa]|uniref:Reverse transcriptase Ty1/copia-type domain-containing protein n=1 Tax=Actinidia rufa TaxID=165716 RepID=A0A7J0DMI2_9ERIC|nr:hypothetical protein Acr_00g0052120 [Actinidia rufa]
MATALATPGSRGCGSSGGSCSFSASGSQSSGGSASRSNECTFCHATDHRLLTCPIRVCKTCRQRGPGHYRSDCPNNPTRRDTCPQSTAATAGVSSTASVSPTLIDISDLPALVSAIMSASDVDVPADLLDDTLHVAPPPIVYPVESSSTDPAPPVLPLVPLPSDIPVCRSIRFPPPGSSSSSNQVCRLRRALYGLKQAPRAWFDEKADELGLVTMV